MTNRELIILETCLHCRALCASKLAHAQVRHPGLCWRRSHGLRIWQPRDGWISKDLEALISESIEDFYILAAILQLFDL